MYQDNSGQRINFQKYETMFSPNTNHNRKNLLSNLLGIPIVPKIQTNLGIPIQIRLFKSQIFNFILDRIRKKTQGLES